MANARQAFTGRVPRMCPPLRKNSAAREILDKGSERIARELNGQPIIEADLMETMGRVYQNLGLYGRAERA